MVKQDIYNLLPAFLGCIFSLAIHAEPDPALVEKYKTELAASPVFFPPYTKHSEAEIEALVEAFKSNNNVTTLGIISSGDNFKPEIFKKFAEDLKSNTTLKKLILGFMNIGDTNAAYLADALLNNNTLEELVLAGSHIGALGAISLAEALTHNRSLKDINLEDTPVGNKGAQAFLDALNKNITLTNLLFSSYKTKMPTAHETVKDELMKLIDKKLERNQRIQALLNKIKSVAPALLSKTQGSNFDVLLPEVKLQILQKLFESTIEK